MDKFVFVCVCDFVFFLLVSYFCICLVILYLVGFFVFVLSQCPSSFTWFHPAGGETMWTSQTSLSSPLQMVILVHRVILKFEKYCLQEIHFYNQRNTVYRKTSQTSPLQMVILVHRVILKFEKYSALAISKKYTFRITEIQFTETPYKPPHS